MHLPPPDPEDQPDRQALRRQWAGGAVLVAWAPLLVLILGTLMAGHWAPLPRPEGNDAALASRLLADTRDRATTDLVAFHVLDGGCRCSLRIADHLRASERPGDVHEVVLLTGPADPLQGQLEERGFEVVALDRAALQERYGLLSAPMLLLAERGSGALRYAGGYTPRQQSLDVRDLTLIEAARGGSGTLAALPVFGCGVAPALRDSLDPLGIKY